MGIDTIRATPGGGEGHEIVADIDHHRIDTGEVSLHVATAGPEDGDPVVLLHGFPEFWYGWRHQIPALGDAGYRVVVPDQRGYNTSDKPDGFEAYTVDRLAGDAVGLLDALGHESARFVGHDWGAAVLWQTMLSDPDRVDRGAILNVPHPAVFQDVLSNEPRQKLKSYYMYFFQLPKLPEFVLRAGGWRGLSWFMHTSNRESTFTDADMDRYREAWSQPGAITGMVNWYRATFQGDVDVPPTMDVSVPTMVLWGTEDAYLIPEMAAKSVGYCRDGRLERFDDATHWLHHEEPGRVNRLLLDYFD